MRKMHGEGTNPEIVRTWRRATAGDWALCHGASTPLPLPPGLPCARHTCSVPLGHPPGRSRIESIGFPKRSGFWGGFCFKLFIVENFKYMQMQQEQPNGRWTSESTGRLGRFRSVPKAKT